jgi:hypothetical protein
MVSKLIDQIGTADELEKISEKIENLKDKEYAMEKLLAQIPLINNNDDNDKLYIQKEPT